jgi:hypothetical protein
MNLKIVVLFLFIFGTFAVCSQNTSTSKGVDYIKTSIDLLEAIRNKKDSKKYEKIFSESTVDGLDAQLTDDAKRKAFWINVYNAYIMIRLDEQPELYDDRSSFFKDPHIPIAGRVMSFGDIEHGIIRKSQSPILLGLIANPFPRKYERKLRVKDRDWRIHFALNCGAKSCPPVNIYKPEFIDNQLNIMTANYLKNETRYEAEEDAVYTTSLFSWFRGDFGLKCGVKKILVNQGLIPDKKVKLKFTNYSWELDLHNFTDSPAL